jgi:AcrR family transcriptional regulator
MTTNELSTKAGYHHGSLRDALINAALLRLQADGVAKLSLRSLAADVGVSPTAVYRHFADKQALLAAIACDGFVGMTRHMQRQLGSEPCDTLTALQRIGVGYVDYAAHHPAHYRLMFGQRMVERKRFPDLYQASTASFAMLRDNIQRGLDEGVFKPLPIDLLTTTAWALVHGMAMLTIDGLASIPPQHMQMLAGQVSQVLAEGLLHNPVSTPPSLED